MYIDRRYRPRRRRSPWSVLIVVFLLAAGAYLLATRTRFFQNPFNPLQPTPTPTRSAVSYLAEAEDHLRAGRLRAATQAYGRAAELEPTDAEAFARQAYLLTLLGHPAEGAEMARKAIAITPTAMNLGILAMALDWSGRYDEAIKVALQAVDKDPLSAEAHAFLAEVYADKNNWERGLEEAQTAVKLNPNSAIVQRNLGYVLEHQGRYAEAIAAYEAAARLEPRLGYIYIGAGNSYLAQADYKSALVQFQKAVEANPDSPTGYDALGHGSTLAGDPDRAISMLRKAIEIDPAYGTAYAHLGHAYYTQLNWEAAIENITKAIELGVHKEQYYYELGLAHAYLKDCTDAVKWLQKALDLNPDSRPAQDGLKLCTKG
jgi:tetratricopeptide (TPR) repeat protein